MASDEAKIVVGRIVQLNKNGPLEIDITDKRWAKSDLIGIDRRVHEDMRDRLNALRAERDRLREANELLAAKVWWLDGIYASLLACGHALAPEYPGDENVLKIYRAEREAGESGADHES